MNRLLIAAEWLKDNDKNWWFYSKALELNKGISEIVLVGNSRFYNENDRNSLLGHILYITKTILFSLRLCLLSKKRDVVFTWNQLPALIMATFLRITGVKRKIICQNFLYRPSSSTLVDFFRRKFYNYAIQYKHIYFSLQNEELLGYYNQKCKLSLRTDHVYFVPDCLPVNRVPLNLINESTHFNKDQAYIFTGGEANRDWSLVMDIARRLPDQTFYCVARKRFFDPALEIPSNVKMFWDTSLEEYFRLLAGCKISLIPIKDRYNPAGLLLLFDSITLNKSVVSTDTPYLASYLSKHKNELCFTNAIEAVDRINYLSRQPTLDPLKKSLDRSIREWSPDTFAGKHLHKFYQLSEVN